VYVIVFPSIADLFIDLFKQIYTLEPKCFVDAEDSSTRGRRWADEAYVHLAQIEEPSFPLLQGLFAMFCYEGVLGSGTKSVEHYLRAMETYEALNKSNLSRRRLGVDEERIRREYQASSWCMWGFYCTEWYF
jgi:hypothetical protein